MWLSFCRISSPLPRQNIENGGRKCFASMYAAIYVQYSLLGLIMAGDKFLFSFVHATDFHFEAGDHPEFPEANKRIACLVEDIKKLNLVHPLKFVILTGDLTNRGSANRDELSSALKLCRSLPVPFYTVAGNHDLAPNRSISAAYPGKEDYHEGSVETSGYAEIFGLHGIRFSFQAESYRFAGVSLRDGDPDGILPWLEKEIRQARSKVILSAHYGLYPPRDAGPLYRWGFSRIGTILHRLRSIVDGESNRVVLYLYGHNHVNSVVRIGDTYHVSGGGIQRGCTGYRLFSCYENRIEGRFLLLSKPALHSFEYWGPEGCIDSTHENAKEYHGGNSGQESAFVMDLTGR